MAKRRSENRDEGTKRESVYRGRLIEVVKEPPASPGRRAAEQPTRSRLFIDGQEIEIEEAEDGVMSHQNMFKVYSSAFELAEDLIRQSGDQKIKPAAPHGNDHDHNHDHHRAGETDAGASRQGRSTAAGARTRKPR